MVMRVVLASNNAKKLHELQGLLASVQIRLVTQGSLGIAEVHEPHRTFVENALVKARHAAWHAQGAALADDSGLCVEALGGLPGVDSAHIADLGLPEGIDGSREARRTVQDQANNAWLLDQLRTQSDRRGHYLCVLVALRRAEDPEPLIATARWHGVVLETPQGEGGFGYDPLMQMDGTDLSVASMSAARKSQMSHRALAAAAMVQQMHDVWRVEGVK